MAYKKRRKKKYGIVTVIVAIIVAVLGILYSQGYLDGLLQREEPPAPVEGQVEFHFIDVGQGDAALIRTSEGHVLIDAGTNASEEALVAYLKAEGITKLAYAVFTHPHEDHIGGADAVLEYCEVENVILPDKTATTVVYNRMMDAIEADCAGGDLAQDWAYTEGYGDQYWINLRFVNQDGLHYYNDSVFTQASTNLMMWYRTQLEILENSQIVE